MKHIRVIAPYRAAYTQPLKVRCGENVTVGLRDDEWEGWIRCTGADGQSSWVPETYVDVRNGAGKMNRDYDGTELTVHEGELLTAENEESGWLWCVNASGERGWIPAEHATTISE